MALKPWTMSFKETNPDEVLLHEILKLKTSPMAFAKDVLIDVLVRGNNPNIAQTERNMTTTNCEIKSEIEEICDI